MTSAPSTSAFSLVRQNTTLQSKNLQAAIKLDFSPAVCASVEVPRKSLNRGHSNAHLVEPAQHRFGGIGVGDQLVYLIDAANPAEASQSKLG